MGCNENNPCKGSNVKVAVSRCNHKCNPPTIYTTEILKPNCVCGNNALTQCMLMRENVKYVIKYDFTLLGEEITVPKNCIFEFDGGSLKNGTIVGQDTVFINVGDVDIWGTNLIRKGTWREHSGGGSIDVDDHLSKTSTNPVQNKVITEALEEIVLPDKPYDPEAHSGLGRKTLQLKDDSNILTQEDFSDANTIYVVQYDFDLNGQELVIPQNCVLEFDGGSVTNGKLISNHTILLGDYIKSKDYLIGVFYNTLGNVLDYDFEEFGNYRDFLVHGELKEMYNGSVPGYNFGQMQSLASDENYFFALNACYDENEHQHCAISLYDRNFNYKGSTVITNYTSHGNDAAIYNGDIYIPRCINGDFGLLKVNKSAVINACINNITSIQAELLLSEGLVVSIDYDPYSNCFWIEGDYSGAYDTNFNRIRPFEYSQSKIQQAVGTNVTMQSIIFRRGVVYNYGWAYNLNGSNVGRKGVLCVIDSYSGEVLANEFYTPSSGFLCEPEGAFWDEVYGCPICGYGATAYSNADFITYRSKKEKHVSVLVNALGDVHTLDEHIVYVNGSASNTGFSTGQEDKPFKTLTSALACTIGLGRVIIYIQDNTVDYVLPAGYIQNALISIRGIPSFSTEAQRPRIKVTGRVQLYTSGQLDFRLVLLYSDNTNRITVTSDSYLSMDQVSFNCDHLYVTNEYNGSVQVQNSHIFSSNDTPTTFETMGNYPTFCSCQLSKFTLGYGNTIENVIFLQITGRNDVKLSLDVNTAINSWLLNRSSTVSHNPVEVCCSYNKLLSYADSILKNVAPDTLVIRVYDNYSQNGIFIGKQSYITKYSVENRRVVFQSTSDTTRYYKTPTEAATIEDLRTYIANNTNDTVLLDGTRIFIRNKGSYVYWNGYDLVEMSYSNSLTSNGKNLIEDSTNLKIRQSSGLREESGIWRLTSGGGTDHTPPTRESANFDIFKGVNTKFVMTPLNDQDNVEIAYSIKLIVGQPYTFSCWVKGTGRLYIGAGYNTYEGRYIDIDSTNWMFVLATFDITDSMVNSNGWGSLYFHREPGGITPLEICAPKFEFGYTTTNWIVDTSIGVTNDRPLNAPIGYNFFDETLNKLIIRRNSGWISAAGENANVYDTPLVLDTTQMTRVYNPSQNKTIYVAIISATNYNNVYAKFALVSGTAPDMINVEYYNGDTYLANETVAIDTDFQVRGAVSHDTLHLNLIYDGDVTIESVLNFSKVIM